MCLAGVEHNLETIVSRAHVANMIAAKAGVSIVGSKVTAGHFWLKIRDSGWVRSVDLLNEDPSDRRKRAVDAAHAAANRIMSFA